jgi:DNA-binding transcriptional ArsR family regulator
LRIALSSNKESITAQTPEREKSNLANAKIKKVAKGGYFRQENTVPGFKITAADGSSVEIEPGGFYFNTKARGRRIMITSLSNAAHRVYACLELATMGFQQELAVIMERGKIRHLRPADVVEQTGLSKQHVRRAFEELEDAGLAKRESDDGNGLRNGHVRLYSWAEPHPTAEIKEVASRGHFPDWFPSSWQPLKSLMKRLRLVLSIDEVAVHDYLQKGEAAARDYESSKKVAMEFLRSVCASRRYKEERTERTSEKTFKSAAAASSRAQEQEQDDAVASRASSGPSQANLILEALSEYGEPDLGTERILVKGCRAEAIDATAEEIVHFVHLKGKAINSRIDNPIGLLVATVPRFFSGNFRANLPSELLKRRVEREKKREEPWAPHQARKAQAMEEFMQRTIEDLEEARRTREEAESHA